MQENLEVGTEGYPRSSWEYNDNEPLKMHGCTKYTYMYLHNTENSKQIFREMKLGGLAFMYLCERFIYFHDRGSTFLIYCVFCGPIEGIYKLLTDT
jgi:hypothetical protein